MWQIVVSRIKFFAVSHHIIISFSQHILGVSEGFFITADLAGVLELSFIYPLDSSFWAENMNSPIWIVP